MIRRLRFYTALIAAKLAYLAIRILNRSSGTSFVGLLALKICPDFLTQCSRYIKKKNITVTGTNGKSTTSSLVANILRAANQRVLHNIGGANMMQGFANTFALALHPFKRFDYSVMESDEAYVTKLFDYMKSTYLIVTNIYPDQVDRYADIDVTASYIKEGIDKNPDLKLILNVDVPVVAKLGEGKSAVYFGMERIEHNCEYEKSINTFENSNCDYCGSVIVYDEYSDLTVKNRGMELNFRINIAGLYNAYNALAAITLGIENGLNQEEIQRGLDNFTTIPGRDEKRTINGHSAMVRLIKNPAGTNLVLKSVNLKSNILIAVNNNIADGTDISWLWDTEFERLKGVQNPIITSGIKADDVAKRLKDAGIPEDKIVVESSLKKAVEMISAGAKDSEITILPTYTVLQEINKYK